MVLESLNIKYKDENNFSEKIFFIPTTKEPNPNVNNKKVNKFFRDLYNNA